MKVQGKYTYSRYHHMESEEAFLFNDSKELNRVCRICQDEENGASLYSPCLCKSYVHQTCLVNWLKAKQGVLEEGPLVYEAQCEICLTDINFKRTYNESQSKVGFFTVLNTTMKSVYPYLKLTKYIFLFCNILWLIFNTFAVRKYYLFKEFPSFTLEYIFRKSFFFIDDLSIFLQASVFVLSVLPSVWSAPLGKKIVNQYFGNPIEQKVPVPFSVSFFRLNMCMFFLAPLISTACLIVFGVIPTQAIKFLFKLQGFSNASIHLLGSFLSCFIVSLLPVEKLKHLKSSQFVLLFYTKYCAKSATVLYLRLLLSVVMMKPIIDFFFGNALFGKNNIPISIKNMTLQSLFLSPYRGFVVFTLSVMQFSNQSFFRNGSIYFAPKTNEANKTPPGIFLCSTFSLVFQTFTDIVHMLGTFTITIGAALTLLVAYKKEVAPMSFGIIIRTLDEEGFFFAAYNPQIELLWSNMDNLFFVLGPLLSSFSVWYFKPFALVLARYFRLSSFLFGENNVSERGHLVYRRWKHKWFAPHIAQMSNPDLYTQPQFSDGVPHLFEKYSSVDAYFVPDGRFARVPNHVKTNPTKRYFVTVNKNDQVLDSKPIDVPMAKSELMDFPAYSYDVVYIPPWFRVRMFCFYFFMGVIVNITSLYMLLSSNFFGNKLLGQAVKLPRLQLLIDIDTYFTYANVFLGAALQLFLFNSFKNSKIARQEFGKITSMVRNFFIPFILVTYVVTVVQLFSGGMSFYVTTVYNIVYENLIKHETIDADPSKFYFGLPLYLLTKHSNIFLIPCGICFGISMFLVMMVIQADGTYKQIASAAWKALLKPSLKYFFRYFVIPIGSQLLFVLIQKFEFISSLQDFKQQIFLQFFTGMGTWDRCAFLMFGPVLFSVFVFNDVAPVVKKYWHRTKKTALDNLNKDKLVLENVDQKAKNSFLV